MDKRDLSNLFRERLKMLLTRSDLNQSAFATAVGIDRSALSQLLSGATTRLPRAETLLNIAAEFKVSLDWLLGLHTVYSVGGAESLPPMPWNFMPSPPSVEGLVVAPRGRSKLSMMRDSVSIALSGSLTFSAKLA